MATSQENTRNLPTLDISGWPLLQEKEFLLQNEVAQAAKGDSIRYLRSLGYEVEEYVDPGGRGATGGQTFFDTVSFILQNDWIIKALFILVPVIFREFKDRIRKRQLDKRISTLTVSLAFKTDDVHWTKSLDPMHASKKMNSMFDMYGHLWSYLSNKYPNFHFDLRLSFDFNYLTSGVGFNMLHAQNGLLNQMKFRAMFSQNVFFPGRGVNVSINKLGIIKRIDHQYLLAEGLKTFPKDKVYYFVLPSMLTKDLIYRAKVAIRKMRAGNS